MHFPPFFFSFCALHSEYFLLAFHCTNLLIFFSAVSNLFLNLSAQFLNSVIIFFSSGIFMRFFFIYVFDFSWESPFCNLFADSLNHSDFKVRVYKLISGIIIHMKLFLFSVFFSWLLFILQFDSWQFLFEFQLIAGKM